MTDDLDRRGHERLELLDRIADRVPELDLDASEVGWTTLPDGAQALLVNGGGIDGGTGAFFANHGADVTVIGSLAPMFEGYLGCVVIRPDGTRVLARTVPDPLAHDPD